MNRFKEIQFGTITYRTDRVIITITALLILLIAITSLSYSKFTGKTYYYTECPGAKTNNSYDKQCFNAFYQSNLCGKEISNDDPLCSKKILLPGETLGEKAPWIVQNFGLLGGIVLILGMILNTLIWNRHIFRKE